MAYKSDMKKINLALSTSDMEMFKSIKDAFSLKLDSECIRYCIRETYTHMQYGDSSSIFLNLIKELDSVKAELIKAITRS